MNDQVFTNMLSVVDDAIDLAESAVKSAEISNSRSPEPVTLVKVAAVRCQSAAKELMKTGAFREYTGNDLAKSLETASPAGLIELLEKLASRAVFPLSPDHFREDGDLVSKSATTRTDDTPAESKTALWEQACADAGY